MKHLSAFLILSIAACSDSPPIADPDWRLVTTVLNRGQYCIDINSTKNNSMVSNQRDAWTKIVETKGSENNPIVVEDMEYVRFNCAAQTTTLISWIERNGDITRSEITPENQLSPAPILPGSVGAKIFNAVCAEKLDVLQPCGRDLFADGTLDPSSNSKPRDLFDELGIEPAKAQQSTIDESN